MQQTSSYKKLLDLKKGQLIGVEKLVFKKQYYVEPFITTKSDCVFFVADVIKLKEKLRKDKELLEILRDGCTQRLNILDQQVNQIDRFQKKYSKELKNDNKRRRAVVRRQKSIMRQSMNDISKKISNTNLKAQNDKLSKRTPEECSPPLMKAKVKVEEIGKKGVNKQIDKSKIDKFRSLSLGNSNSFKNMTFQADTFITEMDKTKKQIGRFFYLPKKQRNPIRRSVRVRSRGVNHGSLDLNIISTSILPSKEGEDGIQLIQHSSDFVKQNQSQKYLKKKHRKLVSIGSSLKILKKYSDFGVGRIKTLRKTEKALHSVYLEMMRNKRERRLRQEKIKNRNREVNNLVAITDDSEVVDIEKYRKRGFKRVMQVYR